MLVHRCIPPIAYKSHILGHVDLFAEILDVHSQIHNHFVSRLRALVLDQETAGYSANNSALKFEHHLNVLVTEECLRLLQLFVTLRNLLQIFNMLLTHKRVVCLGLLLLLVKADDDNLLAIVNTINFADNSEMVHVKANYLGSFDNFLIGICGYPHLYRVHWMTNVTTFH
jgi:hypothetical protein